MLDVNANIRICSISTSTCNHVNSGTNTCMASTLNPKPYQKCQKNCFCRGGPNNHDQGWVHGGGTIYRYIYIYIWYILSKDGYGSVVGPMGWIPAPSRWFLKQRTPNSPKSQGSVAKSASHNVVGQIVLGRLVNNLSEGGSQPSAQCPLRMRNSETSLQSNYGK